MEHAVKKQNLYNCGFLTFSVYKALKNISLRLWTPKQQV